MGSNFTQRAPGVDALRIVGAFLVIGLHVGEFSEWPAWAIELGRDAARWVVPFFFLAMGYFVGQRAALVPSTLSSAHRLLQILVVCTGLYGVLFLLQSGPRAAFTDLVTPNFLVRGIWVHLWFLHAAVAALLLAAARPDWMTARGTWVVLAVVILAASRIDMLFAMSRVDWGTMFLSRFVAGIALVWVGIKLAAVPRVTLTRLWPWLTLSGLLLFPVQAYIVVARGGPPGDLQMPIGAVLLGVGALALGLSLSSRPWLEQLADWGRRFALGVYLLHPLFIEAVRTAGVARSDLTWLYAALLTFAVLVVMERWLPGVKALLDGRPMGKRAQASSPQAST